MEIVEDKCGICGKQLGETRILSPTTNKSKRIICKDCFFELSYYEGEVNSNG